MKAFANCTIAVMLTVFSLVMVGELAVEAMNAPAIMPHSQAHVMGFMCRTGRGAGDRTLEATEEGSTRGWRIADRLRPGFFYNQDDLTIGVLEYLNLSDCQRSTLLLNRRSPGKPRYYCTLAPR